MPEFRLARLLRHIELRKSLDFILQLDDKTNLRGYTEVSNYQETYSFKECLPLQLLLITPQSYQILKLDIRYLHYITDVK